MLTYIGNFKNNFKVNKLMNDEDLKLFYDSLIKKDFINFNISKVGQGFYPKEIRDTLLKNIVEKYPLDSKICILDDLSLHLYNDMIDLGYKKISLIFGGFKKEGNKISHIENDNSVSIIKSLISSNFKEFKNNSTTAILSVKEFLNMNNINDKFDLVIANPPYGYQNCLARKIIKECLDISDTNIFLCPLKSFDFIEHNIISLDKVSADVFDDAKIRELSICEFSRKTFNEEITLESLIMKNNTSFYLIKAFNLTKNKLNIKNCVRSTYANNYQDDCLFLITTWTPLDGVHVDDSAKDIQHNIYKKQLDWTKLDSVDKVIIFNSVVEKDNFTYWWYSNPKSGLADFIISFINKLAINTCDVFTMVLPAIDWSRTDVEYTDEYVLSQMGLKWNANKDGVERI